MVREFFHRMPVENGEFWMGEVVTLGVGQVVTLGAFYVGELVTLVWAN